MLRIGIVGCGDVCQHTYLPKIVDLDRQGRLRLVAIADQIPQRAATLAERYSVPNAFLDHHQLLESGVDLVVNLTPMQAHAEVSLDSIAAGTHVYTEKPIATSLADSERVIDAARRKGVVVASAPAVLTHPHIQQALRWTWSGAIGRICFIRARGSHPGPDRLADFRTDPTWFYQGGGGPLFDMGVYPLHVITGALGPARRVVALSGKALPHRTVGYGVAAGKEFDIEVDDNTHVMLDFGDATYAIVDATYCVLSSEGPRMEIYGQSGVLNLASEPDEPPIKVFRADLDHEMRGWLTPESVYRGRANPPKPRPPLPPYSLVNGVEHMVDHLENGWPLLLTAEHAQHVLEIMLAAQRAAQEGRTIDLATSFERPQVGDFGGSPQLVAR